MRSGLLQERAERCSAELPLQGCHGFNLGSDTDACASQTESCAPAAPCSSQGSAHQPGTPATGPRGRATARRFSASPRAHLQRSLSAVPKFDASAAPAPVSPHVLSCVAEALQRAASEAGTPVVAGAPASRRSLDSWAPRPRPGASSHRASTPAGVPHAPDSSAGAPHTQQSPAAVRARRTSGEMRDAELAVAVQRSGAQLSALNLRDPSPVQPAAQPVSGVGAQTDPLSPIDRKRGRAANATTAAPPPHSEVIAAARQYIASAFGSPIRTEAAKCARTVQPSPPSSRYGSCSGSAQWQAQHRSSADGEGSEAGSAGNASVAAEVVVQGHPVKHRASADTGVRHNELGHRAVATGSPPKTPASRRVHKPVARKGAPLNRQPSPTHTACNALLSRALALGTSAKPGASSGSRGTDAGGSIAAGSPSSCSAGNAPAFFGKGTGHMWQQYTAQPRLGADALQQLAVCFDRRP